MHAVQLSWNGEQHTPMYFIPGISWCYFRGRTQTPTAVNLFGLLKSGLLVVEICLVLYEARLA